MVVKMVLPVGLCLLLSVVLQNLSQMNKPLLFLKTNYQYRVTRKRDGTGEVIIKRDSGFFGSACFPVFMLMVKRWQI